MKEQIPLPDRPADSTAPKDMVYIGRGGTPAVIDAGGLNFKYYCTYDNRYNWWGIGEHANFYQEFGSPNWNRWAEALYDLKEIPEDYIWIGVKPRAKIGVISSFVGGFLEIGGWDIYDDLLGDSDSHYIVHKDDPVAELARQHYTQMPVSAPKSNSESTLEKNAVQLLEDYKKAQEELQEAKKNKWQLNVCGINIRDIDEGDHIELHDGVLFLRNYETRRKLLWSEYKIIKPDPIPDFPIVGDGNGPYKPEYHTDYWKFGCAKICHSLIQNLVDAFESNNKDTETRNLQSVTIGQGEFTIKQLQQLNDYHRKQS